MESTKEHSSGSPFQQKEIGRRIKNKKKACLGGAVLHMQATRSNPLHTARVLMTLTTGWNKENREELVAKVHGQEGTLTTHGDYLLWAVT